MSKTHKEMVHDLYLDCDEKDLIELGLCENHNIAYEPIEKIAYAHQVGGTHYQNKIQPWDIIDSWNLSFYEGNIIKYLLRRKNSRVEDLKKMIHYAQKLLEIEEGQI
jgi:hypothetical protein